MEFFNKNSSLPRPTVKSFALVVCIPVNGRIVISPSGVLSKYIRISSPDILAHPLIRRMLLGILLHSKRILSLNDLTTV